MDITTLTNFVGISIPLITIAGTAVAFIVKLYTDARKAQKDEFFTMMQLIDGQGTMASKLAAIYQLRQFSQHREFIIRFCKSQQSNISGDGADFLALEMEETVKFFK